MSAYGYNSKIVASEDRNIVDIRNFSVATTGYEVKRKTLYGVVTKLN